MHTYERRRMKKLVRRLIYIDILAAALLCIILITVTSGFNIFADKAVNLLNFGDNRVTIEEDFGEHTSFIKGQSYTKDVSVRNTGSVPCYVRVFAEVEDPDTASALSIDFNTTEWTEKQSDGYYYYKEILDEGKTTTPLFTKLMAEADITDFRMICYCETVQAEGFGTAAQAFSNIK